MVQNLPAKKKKKKKERKELPAKAGDPGLIPGLGRSLGEGNGTPL